MKFTAQCGEDRWLMEHWPMLGLPEAGFFVDFGAGNGVRFSNSYWLEKSRGWRGLLCEPNPHQTIEGRDRSIIERVAVGPAGKAMIGLTQDPDLAGILRSPETTTDEPRLSVVHTVEVDCVPLTTLLERHHIDRVDLISIDTEGTEIEAWRTLDLTRWRPRVCIIEYSTWELPDQLTAVTAEWTTAGYRLAHTTKYNCIFVDGR